MTYQLLGAIVLAAGLFGGALSWLTRRKVSFATLRMHYELGSAVFLQLGVVFAVLLAFVFNQVWSEYNSAAEAIQQECASLQGVAMMAESLPEAASKQVRDAVAAYGQAIVDDEWPAMRRNERSAVATDRQVDIWRSVIRASKGDGGLGLRGQMLSMLARAHQMRETRLAQATADVPHLLWVVLLSLAFTMTATMFFFGIEYVWSQVGFTAVFIGCITLSLLLVYALDQPFQGAVAIAPEAFQRLVASLKA